MILTVMGVPGGAQGDPVFRLSNKSRAGDDRHREIHLAVLHRLLDDEVSFARKGAVDALALQLGHVAAKVAAGQSCRDLTECEREDSPVSERNLIDHQVCRLGRPGSFSLHGVRLAGVDSMGEIPVERAMRDIAAEEFGKVHVLNAVP